MGPCIGGSRERCRSGRVPAQLQLSLVPWLPVAVQPSLGYRADEETSSGQMEMLGRSVFQPMGSVGIRVQALIALVRGMGNHWDYSCARHCMLAAGLMDAMQF